MDEQAEIRRLNRELACERAEKDLAERGIFDAVRFFIPLTAAAFLIGLGLGVLGALVVWG